MTGKKDSTKAAEPKVVDSKPNGENKKKRKEKIKGPDRPQPAWLFPPDDENPVLTPKHKSDEKIEKEKQERAEAIQFMKNKACSAPSNKPQPPPLLLQLIGSFLGEYTYNSTSRIFTNERKARVRTAGWEDPLGEKFKKGTPNLVQIFKDWHAVWEKEREAEETSSEEESSANEASDGDIEMKDEADSSGDGYSSDDSDAPKKKKKPAAKEDKTVEPKKATKDKSAKKEDKSIKVESTKKSGREKATVNGLVDKLKARQLPTPAVGAKQDKSSSSSESSSDSSSSEDEKPARSKTKKEASKGKESSKGKQEKLTNGRKAKAASSSESSSEESSDSESDSDGGAPVTSKSSNTVSVVPIVATASDSSNTLKGSPVKEVAESSSSSSDSSDSSSDSYSEDKPSKKAKASVTTTTTITTTKRKRSSSPKPKEVVATKVVKKNNAPFQRIPTDQKIDPRLSSNKYVPYDYAQRAHEDLIVTKGKGFTKEKNKKKRGSYRGGQIDVAGGKGIKFED